MRNNPQSYEGGADDNCADRLHGETGEARPREPGFDEGTHVALEQVDRALGGPPLGETEASWLRAAEEANDAFALIERSVGSDKLRAYTGLRDQMFETAQSAELPKEPHGVVLWNGGDAAKEAARQIATERRAQGDYAVTIGDTPAGQALEQHSDRLQDLLDGVDRATCSTIYRTLEQPAWTIMSRRLVASAEGRVDVVVKGEVSQDKVLQPEIIKAWNATGIREIHFHQIVMDGDKPACDPDGRIALREHFVKDW